MDDYPSRSSVETPPVYPRQVDVARAARVSSATVSLALARSARIPEKTRLRVEAAAKKLGYRIDQAARTLQSRRQRQTRRETVGIITFFPEDWGEHSTRWARGLKEHLDVLGYGLDVFPQPTSSAEWQRLSRILQARGIRGIILHCRHDDPAKYPLDWSKFATVAWAANLQSVFSPSLAAAHFEDSFKIVKQLKDRGYRQPGLLLVDDHQPPLRGGFLAGMALHFPQMTPHIWEYRHEQVEPFLRWIRDQRIDAVCGNISPRFLERLYLSGARFPKTLGMCSVDVESKNLRGARMLEWARRLSGMKQARLRGFRLAADLLHARLCRNDYGLSTDGVHISLRASWQEGETLPSKLKEVRTTKSGSKQLAA